MSEICKNCGREKSTHDYECIDGPDSEMTFACLSELSDTDFEPSGRVAVPAEFVEAVLELRDIWYSRDSEEWTACECMKAQDKVWARLNKTLGKMQWECWKESQKSGGENESMAFYKRTKIARRKTLDCRKNL